MGRFGLESSIGLARARTTARPLSGRKIVHRAAKFITDIGSSARRDAALAWSVVGALALALTTYSPGAPALLALAVAVMLSGAFVVSDAIGKTPVRMTGARDRWTGAAIISIISTSASTYHVLFLGACVVFGAANVQGASFSVSAHALGASLLGALHVALYTVLRDIPALKV